MFELNEHFIFNKTSKKLRDGSVADVCIGFFSIESSNINVYREWDTETYVTYNDINSVYSIVKIPLCKIHISDYEYKILGIWVSQYYKTTTIELFENIRDKKYRVILTHMTNKSSPLKELLIFDDNNPNYNTIIKRTDSGFELCKMSRSYFNLKGERVKL
jgi:hypothetical protein